MSASQVRTDLALERAAAAVRLPNITQSKRGTYFQITQIDVPNDAAGIPLGKPKGRYVTLEAAALSRFSDHYQEMTEELAQELSAFLPEGEILVVCLGNQAITPDALGPRIAGKLLATRHLQTELQEEQELSFLRALRPVSVFTPGVLGQTGMESAALTAAVCKEIQPAAVLVIDALACSALNRLGTTIQLCDSGISPGSGVANHRAAFSEQTLGVPVLAVGVPTVVDLRTIVESITERTAPRDTPNLMVTPRDKDRLIDHASGMLATAINLALQPSMTFADAEGLG